MTVRHRLFDSISWMLPSGVAEPLRLSLARTGYLRTVGWVESRRLKSSVNANGEPVPWITYPAFEFLRRRLPSDIVVFEFGMGNSTLWWAKHARTVTAVDNDVVWFERISDQMPANVTALLRADDKIAYQNAAKDCEEPIDILVIDGRLRVGCCKASLAFLSRRGVVIWDNTERDYYEEGYRYLANEGFKRVDFWGLLPIITVDQCTSIFYRPDNLFNL